MELVCPAGNLPALKRAVDEGADAVYFGFQNTTNARQFAGLNFTDKRAREGIDYAHARGKRVFCAINTYPQPDGWAMWTRAVDQAADLGVDAVWLSPVFTSPMKDVGYDVSNYRDIDPLFGTREELDRV